MDFASQILITHGLWLILGVVFLEQMGLPLPAPLLLLTAGAVSATGKMNLVFAIMATLVACSVADMIRFYLGRHRGVRVLGWLCRISLEPDSCVRRTQNAFTRHGLRSLLVAKFIPGFSTIAPPLAGVSGVSAIQFLFFDGAGSLLYGATCLGLGYFFSDQIGRIGETMTHIGGSALSLVIGLAVLYVAVKYWQRQRLLRELRAARITVAELRRKLDAGENLLIFDLRSRAEVERDGIIIQGAVHLDFSDIETRNCEFPRDHDIVMYCSCPNEVTSARIAQQLRRNGFTRVRPLLGGIDAWRKLNYPTESYAVEEMKVKFRGDN